MIKHSPEPWKTNRQVCLVERPTASTSDTGLSCVNQIIDANGDVVMDGKCKPIDMQRIVACVNACDGIPTSTLVGCKVTVDHRAT